MVLKGAAARKMKKLKLKGRPERSLLVRFKNRTKRDKIVEILGSAHQSIERVFLPRAILPKSVYVLCKEVDDRKSVKDALLKLENEDLGRIYCAKYPKPPKAVEKPKEPKTREIDRLTLVLDMIPVDLDTCEIEKAFPEATKVDRFNKRRCYIHFKTVKQAMKARIMLTKEEVAGHKLNVKFNKVDKTCNESEDTAVDSKNSDDNGNQQS